jgi:DNA uptake protein ComE-like DNA-binding protein
MAHSQADNRAVLATRPFALFPVTLLCMVAFLCISLSAAQTKPKTSAAQHPAPEARIDINHASLDELLKVPGMTRSWAGRIVRFRPYHSKQDLLDKGVVTSEVYDRIKDYVIAHRDQQ